jgi:phage recombination protein Bet
MTTTAIAERAAPRASILAKMAERFNVEPNKLLETLKATAFKGQVTNEQMIALLIVADQYKLNPFTKEIYAFPDKGGIVPVVGVDGWARIINEHSQFDGMSFQADPESCTCSIYRKDRGHPITVTEYMRECKRETGPWKSHPLRMLRHKAMIQCARLAFGFAGIYDEDEAERVRHMGAVEEVAPPAGSSLASVRAAVAAKRPAPAAETVDAETGEVTEPTVDADFVAEMNAAEDEA